MSVTLRDRVWETTTTTGTGDLTLDGAKADFRTFNSAIGVGPSFFYIVVHEDQAAWESGVGSLSDATTLSRDTVIESSNSGSKVSFTSGEKQVFIGAPAKRVAYLDSTGVLDSSLVRSDIDADTLDGQEATAFASAGHTHALGDLSNVTASGEGSGGGFDADTVDGEHAADLGGGRKLLATLSPSGVATAEFTSGIDGTYDEYVIRMMNLVPATDVVDLWLRVSRDAGSNWDSGASDYNYVAEGVRSNTTSQTVDQSTGAAQVLLSPVVVGSATNEVGVSGSIHIYRPSAAEYTLLSWRGAMVDSIGASTAFRGAGARLTAAAVDGLQLLFSSGNIESGEIKLFGVVSS